MKSLGSKILNGSNDEISVMFFFLYFNIQNSKF